MPTPTCLYLVRHGETEWSLSGRHTGRTDIVLTERGKREARELARRLRDIRFAHVLTSPRQRAQQTCRLAGLGAAAEIEPDLAEWDYGDYEGKRSTDIRKVRAGWNRLRALEGNVALFSHGQFGCVLAARWIGLPPAEAQHFALGPASLSILGFGFHHPEVAVIAMWNAASSEQGGLPHSRAADTKTVNPGALERWENEGGEIEPEAVPAPHKENAG